MIEKVVETCRSCDHRPSVWSEVKSLARPAWAFFLDEVLPALIGIILGTSLAVAFLLLALIWWLG